MTVEGPDKTLSVKEICSSQKYTGIKKNIKARDMMIVKVYFLVL